MGVGIWDAEQRAGSWGSVKPGTIMGADGSGTIAAVGSDVTKLQVGDRVYLSRASLSASKVKTEGL